MVTFAVTIYVALTLCAIQPAKAESSYGRPIRPRGWIHDGVGILRTADGASSNPQPKRVKCHYFKNPPVRTYCRVLSMTGVITADAAERMCDSIAMNLLSSKTTSLDRLCTLTRIFSLERHIIWLADVLNETKQLMFDHCKLEVLQENATKLSSNCSTCNVAVICEAGFYHSNGSNCVTVAEKPAEVEYCYFENKTTARESSLRCKAQSAELMDASKLSGTDILQYVTRLVRTDLEFWVDLKKEDVAELSGLITFDPEEIDWNTSCITVWFGRAVPWFFKRNCQELHPIICQNRTIFVDNGQQYENQTDCAYSESSGFGYCVPLDRAFRMTAGLEFCGNQSMALLLGSTLRELYYVYASTHSPVKHDIHQFLIWDSGFLDGRDNISTTCTATSLSNKLPERETRQCSVLLAYMCRQEKPRTCLLPHVSANLHVEENCSFCELRQEYCISREEFTFEESVKVCEELGMTISPLLHMGYNGLEELLKDNYITSFWDVSDGRDVSKCAVFHDVTLVQMDAGCSEKHHAFCTFATAETFTIWLPPEGTDADVATTASGRKKPGHDVCDCGSEEVRIIWEKVLSSKSIEEVVEGIQDLHTKVRFEFDIQGMPSQLRKLLQNVDELVAILSHTEKASKTHQLANSVVDLARETMKKRDVWSRMSEKERRNAAAGLAKSVEDFVIRMIGYQNGSYR